MQRLERSWQGEPDCHQSTYWSQLLLPSPPSLAHIPFRVILFKHKLSHATLAENPPTGFPLLHLKSKFNSLLQFRQHIWAGSNFFSCYSPSGPVLRLLWPKQVDCIPSKRLSDWLGLSLAYFCPLTSEWLVPSSLSLTSQHTCHHLRGAILNKNSHPVLIACAGLF